MRIAKASDLRDIIPMLIRFFEESGYSKHHKVDVEVGAKTIASLIESDDAVLFFEPGVGVVGGRLTYPWYSTTDLLALEYIWYVERSERATGVGELARLLFEEWADSHGATPVFSINATTSEVVLSHMVKHNYDPVELSLVRSK